MGAAYFYHLTRRPIEATLPQLLAKSLEAGWRVYIRGTNQDSLETLVWHDAASGFLPHGIEGGAHDADQPTLLGTKDIAANGATCLISIDGAEVSADEVNTLARVCVIFDGNNETALNQARSQWKALTDAGCPAQYWSEESGNWQKKAER